jgi:hypothetical protein
MARQIDARMVPDMRCCRADRHIHRECEKFVCHQTAGSIALMLFDLSNAQRFARLDHLDHFSKTPLRNIFENLDGLVGGHVFDQFFNFLIADMPEDSDARADVSIDHERDFVLRPRQVLVDDRPGMRRKARSGVL